MARTTEELRDKTPSEVLGVPPPEGNPGSMLAQAMMVVQDQLRALLDRLKPPPPKPPGAQMPRQ